MPIRTPASRVVARRPTVAVMVAMLVLLGVLAGACQTTTPGDDGTSATPPPERRAPVLAAAPSSIPSATDPLDAELDSAIAALVDGSAPTAPEIDRLAMATDIRVSWLLVDLLALGDVDASVVVQGLTALTGETLPPDATPAAYFGDLLLTWDVPAPPGYLAMKQSLFGAHDPTWRSMFAAEASLDWRAVTWGGLARDAIPALDAPDVVPVDAEPSWLADDDIVYGVVSGDEMRAYPRRVLQVHLVVNDTLGGHPLAVAYCPACEAAMAFDRRLPEGDGSDAVLSASGLVDEARPLLVESSTGSLVDSLTGQAVSGPLRDQGQGLAPMTLRVTTWSAWRAAFPTSTVIAEDAGVGRVYVDDPMAGHVAPLLPIGPVDDRMVADTMVIGVVGADGADGADAVEVAIPVDEASAVLDRGGTVELDDVRVVRDGGALTAVRASDGTPLIAVETHWFAWVAAHPGSGIWIP